MTELQNSGKLGLGACVALIVGGMIGSAIFSLSGLTIFTAGPASILSWVIAAVLMLLYGLFNAELATFFPKSGGVYVFPAKAMGKVWGWLSCWGFINANICAIAFSAIYVSIYLGASFPALGQYQVPLALLAILLALVLNGVRFSTAGKINTVLVGGLSLALLIYVCFALFGGSWDGALLTPFFTQGAAGNTGFLSAVPTASVGYGSIVTIAFLVSEVKKPNKTVPRAMFIAMAIVAGIYALIILATIGLVSASFLTENEGMRFIPLFAACFTKLTAYPWLSKVISIAAVLALFTTILVVLTLTAHSIQAAAQDRVLPAALGRDNKLGVPFLASLITAVLSGVVACFPAQTQSIVNLGAFFSIVIMVVNIVALLVARKRFTLPEGGFRAPGGSVLPILTLLLLLLCNSATILSGSLTLWIYTIAWYAVGYLLFRLSPAGREKKTAK